MVGTIVAIQGFGRQWVQGGRLRTMVSEAIRIYNTERPHLALKYKTPDAVHRAL